MQQLVDNHAARSDASRDVGDVRERLMQKSQLNVDAALWNKTSSRRHWLIRCRIPPSLGESPADVQAFVGEPVKVTSRVTDQLRSLSGFDVAQFGPRSDVPVSDSIMTADRLELFRSAIVAVLSIGLASGVGDDSACLARVAALCASFTAAAAELRAHILKNYTNLSTSAARGVICDMVNHNLRLWVQELVRFANQVRPEVIPPPADTVFDAPPVPAFDRNLAF